MDRNIAEMRGISTKDASLSARRAWIEIMYTLAIKTLRSVALRKESVDRNTRIPESAFKELVVALRKESVDRNRQGCGQAGQAVPSLSARRAWIEMLR